MSQPNTNSAAAVSVASTKSAQHTDNRFFQSGIYDYEGVPNNHVLAGHPYKQGKPQNVSMPPFSGSLKELAAVPGRVNQVLWNQNIGEGALIIDQYLFLDDDFNSNVDAVGAAFSKYRGDFVFTIDPVCTQFHQGSIIFAFIPSTGTGPPAVPSYKEVLGMDGPTMILHHTSVETIKIPYQHFQPWLDQDQVMGRLVGFVLMPLIAPATIVNSGIYINVFKSLENAEFAVTKPNQVAWRYLDTNGNWQLINFGTGAVVPPAVEIQGDFIEEQAGNEIEVEDMQAFAHSTDQENSLDNTLAPVEDNIYKILKRGFEANTNIHQAVVNRPADYLQHFKNFFFAHSGSKTTTFHCQKVDQKFEIVGDPTELSANNVDTIRVRYLPRILVNGICGPISVTVARQTLNPISIEAKLETPKIHLYSLSEPQPQFDTFDSIHDDMYFYMMRPLPPQTRPSRTPSRRAQKDKNISYDGEEIQDQSDPDSANDPAKQTAPTVKVGNASTNQQKVQFKAGLSKITRNIPIVCKPLAETAYVVKQFAWYTNDAVGKRIADVPLYEAYTNPNYPVLGYTGYQKLRRFDTHVTLKWTATPFMQGRLVMMYCPYGTSDHGESINTIKNAVSVEIRLNGSEQTAELDVPFFAEGYTDPRGSVQVYVFSQLYGAPQVNLTMYFTYHNFESAIRRPQNLVPSAALTYPEEEIEDQMAPSIRETPRNYVTEVKEFIDRNPLFSINYEFDQSGDAHNPVWKCKATLFREKHRMQRRLGMGCSKMAAKQAASSHLWRNSGVTDYEPPALGPNPFLSTPKEIFEDKSDPPPDPNYCRLPCNHIPPHTLRKNAETGEDEPCFRHKTPLCTPVCERGFDFPSFLSRYSKTPKICGWSVQELLLAGDVEENPGPASHSSREVPPGSAAASAFAASESGDSFSTGPTSAEDTELPSFLKQAFTFLRKLTSGVGGTIGSVISYLTDSASSFGSACMEKIEAWGLDYLGFAFQKKYAKYWEAIFTIFKYTVLGAFVCKKVLALVRGASFSDIALDLIILTFIPGVSSKISDTISEFSESLVQEEAATPKTPGQEEDEPWFGALLTVVVTIAASFLGYSAGAAKGMTAMLSLTMLRPAVADAYKLVKRAFESLLAWFIGPSDSAKPAMAQLEELGGQIQEVMTKYYAYRSDGCLTSMNANEADPESVDMLAFMVRARHLADKVRNLIQITKTQKELWKFIKDVDDTWALILRSRLATIPRMEPIGICLRGLSGCGKSVLSTTTIPEHILLKLGMVETRRSASEQVYSMPTSPDHKYYDGYIGQLVSIFDDFGAQADGTDYSQFLQLVSSASAPLNMASIDDKGIMFCSPFVIVTTNQPVFASKAIQNIQALNRRFPIDYTVKVHTEYLKEGRLNFTKLTNHLEKCKTIAEEVKLYDKVWFFVKEVNGTPEPPKAYSQVCLEICKLYKQKSQNLLRNRSHRFDLENNIDLMEIPLKPVHNSGIRQAAKALKETYEEILGEDFREELTDDSDDEALSLDPATPPRRYATQYHSAANSVDGSEILDQGRGEEEEAARKIAEFKARRWEENEKFFNELLNGDDDQTIPKTPAQGAVGESRPIRGRGLKLETTVTQRVLSEDKQEAVVRESVKVHKFKAKDSPSITPCPITPPPECQHYDDRAVRESLEKLMRNPSDPNYVSPSEKKEKKLFTDWYTCHYCKLRVSIKGQMNAAGDAHGCFSRGDPAICRECDVVGGCSHVPHCPACSNYIFYDDYCRCAPWHNPQVSDYLEDDPVTGTPRMKQKKKKTWIDLWKKFDNDSMTPEESRRFNLFRKGFENVDQDPMDLDAQKVAAWSQAYITHIHQGWDKVSAMLIGEGKDVEGQPLDPEVFYCKESYRALLAVVKEWDGDFVSMARYVKSCVDSLGQDQSTDDYGFVVLKYIKANTLTPGQVATLAIGHFLMNTTHWLSALTLEGYQGAWRDKADFYIKPTPQYLKLANVALLTNDETTLCAETNRLVSYHKQFHFAYRYRRTRYCFLDHFDFLYRWTYDCNYFLMDSSVSGLVLKSLLYLAIRILGFYVIWQVLKKVVSCLFGMCIQQQTAYSSDPKHYAPKQVKKLDAKYVIQQNGVMDDTFERNAGRNTIKIWGSQTVVQDPMTLLQTSPTVFGFAVDSWNILTVRHVLKCPYLYFGVPTERGCIPTWFASPLYHRVCSEEGEEAQDAILIRSPCSLWKCRKVVKQFLTRDNYYASLGGAHKAVMLRTYPLGIEPQTAVYSSRCNYTKEGVKIFAVSLTSQWESKLGWCGIPYSVDGNYVGIHTGQHVIFRDLLMAPITREGIIEGIQALTAVGGHNEHIEVDDIFVKDEANIPGWESDDVGFEVVGTCIDCEEKEIKIFSKYDTEFRSSLIGDYINWPDEHLPSAKNRQILVKQAQKYGFNHPHDPPTFQEHTFPLLYWDQVLEKRPNRSTRILSDAEILNGNEIIAPLMRDTSSGFWSLVSPHGKKAFIDVNYDDVTGERVQTWSKGFYEDVHPAYGRSLNDQLIYVEEEAAQGKRGSRPLIWVTTLKDELRKVEKVLAEKTRVFEAASLDLTILVKKYFGAFGEFYRSNAGIVLGHAIGLDRVANWGAIYTMLTRGGKFKNGIDLDYVAFDSTIPPAFYSYFEQLVELYYHDATARERKIRAVLISNMQHSYQYINGCLVLSHKGNKSGMWLTDVLNSIANQWALMIAFFRIHTTAFSVPPTIKDWCDNVSLFTYGDDVVMGVSDSDLSWYHAANIGLVLFDLGFRATAGDKTPLSGKPRRIRDLTFLKSAFDLRDGIVACPMPMETSYRELNWTRKKHVTNFAVLLGMWNDALLFASWHGPEKYLELRTQLVCRIKECQPHVPLALISGLESYKVLHSNMYVKQAELAETIHRTGVMPVVYRTFNNF